MRFSDQAIIEVRAGNGGAGLVSFRREKYIPKGGPDGGNGGNGGSVYLFVDRRKNHLGDFLYRRIFQADNGRPGRSRCSSGANGADVRIGVPAGTVVFHADTDEQFGELLFRGAELLVARGGDHGMGNRHFASSTNRAPRRSTTGYPGEARRLKLELRMVADVGLIGRPNAGKSSLLNRLTNAQAKVGSYIFTTIHPVLGVIDQKYDEEFLSYTLADIPGLIEGASRGEGLGFYFLRHVLRTRLLLHIVDVSEDQWLDRIVEVQDNLFDYRSALRDHPRWLVLNKSDLLTPAEAKQRLATTRQRFKLPCYTSSALNDQGMHELSNDMTRFIQNYQSTNIVSGH